MHKLVISLPSLPTLAPLYKHTRVYKGACLTPALIVLPTLHILEVLNVSWIEMESLQRLA